MDILLTKAREQLHITNHAEILESVRTDLELIRYVYFHKDNSRRTSKYRNLLILLLECQITLFFSQARTPDKSWKWDTSAFRVSFVFAAPRCWNAIHILLYIILQPHRSSRRIQSKKQAIWFVQDTIDGREGPI